MPDTKISDLTPAGVLAGDELLAGVQAGQNVVVTPSQLRDFIAPPTVLAGASVQITVDDLIPPVATTADTYEGLGLSITPVSSGSVLFTVVGDINYYNAAPGVGIYYHLTTGTGEAPPAGTQSPSISSCDALREVRVDSTLAADMTATDAFSLQCIVHGTVGTPMWLDIATRAIFEAGPINFKNITATAVELPTATLAPASGASNMVTAPTSKPPDWNTAYTRAGLNGEITPTRSGNIVVTISGDVIGASGLAEKGINLNYVIYTGQPGTAGTPCGLVLSRAAPFTLQCIVTGLPLGEPYWYDMGVQRVGGAGAYLGNLIGTAVELP